MLGNVRPRTNGVFIGGDSLDSTVATIPKSSQWYQLYKFLSMIMIQVYSSYKM